MNLYTNEGYPDIDDWTAQNVPFIFCTAARGTGKTFSVLWYIYRTGKKFLFIRNSEKQVEKLKRPELSVFKKINEKKHINVQMETSGELTFFIDHTDEENPRQIGMMAALSTFQNFRGPDLSDYDYICYDEFIPTEQERVVKNPAFAFANLYESCNRNRELEGQKPIQVYCLSNANKIDNPMFVELGLVKRVEKMVRKQQDYMIDRERGFMIVVLQNSPISEAKKNTALYRLFGEQSSFFHMAILNDFNMSDTHLIQSCKLTEYKSLVNVGELTVYQHKSNGSYYVSGHMMKAKDVFTSTAPDLERFRKKYCWLRARYLQELVFFEDYMSIALFDIYLRSKR